MPTHARAADAEWLLLSGGDLWRNGFTLYGGAQLREHAEADGFTFKMLAATGRYAYRAGTTPISATYTLGQALPGYRWARSDLFVSVFAGPEVQHHRTSPDDTGNRLRGDHAGLRAGFEAWWQPTTNAMVDFAANASTLGNSFWLRGATGWRVLNAYVGPEITAFGDTTYRQLRAGLHVTALRLGAMEWSAGAGYAWDVERRSGPYARLGLLLRH